MTAARQLTPVADEANPVYPAGLRERERVLARPQRRWRVGVACSGGGIRSATFCLGFFQGLARRGLLRYVDYLSTVSGGGYFGSFLGRLFCRGHDAESVERVLHDSKSPPVRFLRENGRYLTPNGTSDVIRGAAVAARNWVAVQVVMIVSCLFVLSVFELLAYLALRPLPGEVLRVFAFQGLWVSPFLTGLSALALVIAISLGWAYWLVPDADPWGSCLRGVGRVGVVALAVVVAGGFIRAGAALAIAWPVALTAGATLVAYALGWVWVLLRQPRAAESGVAGRVQALRAGFTHWLAAALVTLGVLVALGAVDAIGITLLRGPPVWIPTVYATVAAVAGAIRPLLRRFMQRNGKPVRLPQSLVAGAVAFLLLFSVLGVLATVPHALAWVGRLDDLRMSDPPWPVVLARQLDLTRLALVALGLGLVAWAIGRMLIFVNRSSLYAVYEGRLRRAYLGASNPKRWGDARGPVPLAESHPDDGITLEGYHPEQFGGPVHLINVTVNETIDGRSQVEQRDRKGTSLAIGPGGLSVGLRHHAVWDPAAKAGLWTRTVRWMMAPLARSRPGAFRVFPTAAVPEPLGVSEWIAISGAAFSTGLGSRTSFGLSVLAGLTNVRLGYWWDSGIAPQERAGRARRSLVGWLGFTLRHVLPVQGFLLDEWLARFHGVALQQWYLTDGGHFENTAAYELIRRRVPFIVVCDCGADPKYAFEDLGNLVRKARVDFGAEIRFLDRAELEGLNLAPELKQVIGPLQDLRPDADPGAGPVTQAHAALAEVAYAGGDKGLLLLVKPSLTGDEPADVTHYRADHPTFPQETTLDQSFDEAQWESYRCLGDHIATQLFQPGEQGAWSPVREMTGETAQP